MKNSSCTVVFLLLVVFLAHACNSPEKLLLRNKRFTQYWKSLPDCCVHEIKNNKYDGMILDGRLLFQTDQWLVPTIESILNRKIDSMQAFNFILDDSVVLSFEKQCLDSMCMSDCQIFTVLYNNLYYRQYLGLIMDGNKYMFVSFDRSNMYCENNKQQRRYCYDTFRLIYSRCFLAPGLDFNPKGNMRFWMLYDTETKKILIYPMQISSSRY